MPAYKDIKIYPDIHLKEILYLFNIVIHGGMQNEIKWNCKQSSYQ